MTESECRTSREILNVFIRSMATRGELGGLAPATAEVTAVLDACGKDIILIETVGAGQDEVEVASMAETTVVVLTPGSGDDVQAMKAGMMEVADVLVVNKADLPGAEGTVAQVKAALNLASRGRIDTPVIETVAPRGTGVPELADAIEAHRRNLETSGEMDRLRVERARRQVLVIVRQLLMEEIVREAQDGRARRAGRRRRQPRDRSTLGGEAADRQRLAVPITIDWLGCATFRLTIDNLVVFLDAYMDRVPSAPPAGLSTDQVERADFVLVGHSHFDHLAGAEVIARNTGARIIGSNESCRVMTECGVPTEQLLPSQGGERHRLSESVTVKRVSQHSLVSVGGRAID